MMRRKLLGILLAAALVLSSALALACENDVDMSKVPTFNVENFYEITVEIHSAQADLSAIKATDADGKDISTSIEIVGSYDLDKEGTYGVTLKAVDEHKRAATLSVKIKVVDSSPSVVDSDVVFSGVEDAFLVKGDRFDKLEGVTAANPVTHEEDVKVTAEELPDTIDTKVAGSYLVKYTAHDSGKNVDAVVYRRVAVVPALTDATKKKDYTHGAGTRSANYYQYHMNDAGIGFYNTWTIGGYEEVLNDDYALDEEHRQGVSSFGGVVEMQGDNIKGISENSANAWLVGAFKLPADNVIEMSYALFSQTGYDAYYRVRIIDENGVSHKLDAKSYTPSNNPLPGGGYEGGSNADGSNSLENEKIAGWDQLNGPWDQASRVVYDLSAFRGQNIFYVIEVNDNEPDKKGIEIAYMYWFEMNAHTVGMDKGGTYTGFESTCAAQNSAEGFFDLKAGLTAKDKTGKAATVEIQTLTQNGTPVEITNGKFSLSQAGAYTAVYAISDGSVIVRRIDVVPGKVEVTGRGWNLFKDLNPADPDADALFFSENFLSSAVSPIAAKTILMSNSNENFRFAGTFALAEATSVKLQFQAFMFCNDNQGNTTVNGTVNFRITAIADGVRKKLPVSLENTSITEGDAYVTGSEWDSFGTVPSGAWSTLSVDLTEFQGQNVILLFETELPAADNFVRWAQIGDFKVSLSEKAEAKFSGTQETARLKSDSEALDLLAGVTAVKKTDETITIPVTVEDVTKNGVSVLASAFSDNKLSLTETGVYVVTYKAGASHATRTVFVTPKATSIANTVIAPESTYAIDNTTDAAFGGESGEGHTPFDADKTHICMDGTHSWFAATYDLAALDNQPYISMLHHIMPLASGEPGVAEAYFRVLAIKEDGTVEKVPLDTCMYKYDGTNAGYIAGDDWDTVKSTNSGEKRGPVYYHLEKYAGTRVTLVFEQSAKTGTLVYFDSLSLNISYAPKTAA